MTQLASSLTDLQLDSYEEDVPDPCLVQILNTLPNLTKLECSAFDVNPKKADRILLSKLYSLNFYGDDVPVIETELLQDLTLDVSSEAKLFPADRIVQMCQRYKDNIIMQCKHPLKSFTCWAEATNHCEPIASCFKELAFSKLESFRMPISEVTNDFVLALGVLKTVRCIDLRFHWSDPQRPAKIRYLLFSMPVLESATFSRGYHEDKAVAATVFVFREADNPPHVLNLQSLHLDGTNAFKVLSGFVLPNLVKLELDEQGKLNLVDTLISTKCVRLRSLKVANTKTGMVNREQRQRLKCKLKRKEFHLQLPKLECFHLDRSSTTWMEIAAIIKAAPNLKELHLEENDSLQAGFLLTDLAERKLSHLTHLRLEFDKWRRGSVDPQHVDKLLQSLPKLELFLFTQRTALLPEHQQACLQRWSQGDLRRILFHKVSLFCAYWMND